MSCRNRCGCRDRDNVMGIQRIALRGPGCISGTGRCEGVAGTGGRCRCNQVLGAAEDFCDEVFGDSGRRCCSNVLGTGGDRFPCGNSNVMGAGGNRCGQVFGTGGGFQCDSVAGTGSRPNRCRPSCWDLKTPITVPR